MKKRMLLMVLLCNISFVSVAQNPAYPTPQPLGNIVEAEYFIDNFIAIGSGTPILLTPFTDLNNLNLSINTSTLQGGYHRLYIRTKDEFGKWSITNTKQFYVDQNPSYTNASSLPNIIQAEYFIDNFVAIGSGTPILLTPFTDLNNLNLSINTSTLQGGYHRLYIRTKDEFGKWSITNTKQFFVDQDPLYPNSSTLLNIVEAEYFIDNFVAIGSGTPILLTPFTDLNNLNLSMNTSTLQGGYHRLYIRTKDANGKWSMTNTKRFYVDQDPPYTTSTPVPLITEAEYFIDHFVPIGSGIAIPVPSVVDFDSLSITLATQDLCHGTHRLYIRTKDANGKWSMTNSKEFDVTGDESIVAYQYFFDNDPGLGIPGNGMIQTMSPTSTFSQNVSISIPTTLNEGFHTFFTRVKNDHCVWSIAERNTFLVQTITPITPIVKYQYYFDTDPGLGIVGNGSVQNVSVDSAISLNLNINIPAGLSEGFHTLFTRVQNSAGVWSIAERNTFMVQALSLATPIIKYQYYFDTDPGLGIAGNGSVQNVSVDSSISLSQNINLPSNLGVGFHTLFTRVQNSAGVWSIAERSSFYIQADNSSQLVTALEYFFDNDPGVGNGLSYPITPDSSININANIPTIGLPDGIHILFVRAKDEFNRWSIIEKDTFTIFNGVLASNLNFDGANDYISLPNGGGLNNSTTGTIEMWVKWNGINQPSGYQSYGAVLGRQENGVFSSHVIALDGPNPNTAKIIWKPYSGNTNALVSNISPGNGWNHIAIVFNGSNHILYINGLKDTASSSSGTFVNATTPLTIGAWTGDGNCYSQSNIDEVRLWTVERSPIEILNYMNCEIASPQLGLQGNYHFNQGFDGANNIAENTLVNETGNANGSLINFALTGSTSNWTNPSAVVSGTHCDVTLNLKLFIEGYYSGSSIMAPVLFNQGLNNYLSESDSIEVELRDAITLNIVATQKTILNIDGTATCNFNPLIGLHYIVIKHRNAIETWSANPITISSITNYDFTISASQAYGSNQTEVESGVWALYSGDINRDDNIDLLDLSEIETDINNFQFGYFATDINGDGNVDLLDGPNVEDNVNNFIFVSKP